MQQVWQFPVIVQALCGYMRVEQYRENPKACVYFCDKRYFRGVMLTGMVEVLEDSAVERKTVLLPPLVQ